MNALKAAYSELKAQHEKDQEFKQRLAEEIRLQQEVVREIQDIVKEKLREREEKKNNLG
jgi:hypothetical protein